MTEIATPQNPILDPLLSARRSRVDVDWILHSAALGAALVVFGMLIALLAVLLHGAMPSIRNFGFGFLTESAWRAQPTVSRDPITRQFLRDAADHIIHLPGNTFGALAVIYGTAITSLIAMVLAVPPSFAAALFLVRIAPRWLAAPVSFLIEFLAAIPSLAYGLWGMFVLCPLLDGDFSISHCLVFLVRRLPGSTFFFHEASAALVKSSMINPASPQYVYPGTSEPLVYVNSIEAGFNHLFTITPGLHWLASPTGGVTGRDMLAGGFILAIMILPIITAVSRDVLRAVPPAQVEGSVALGATWWQSCVEMLKYSRSGLFGAVTLGLARAAGETMAVTMVIGINTQISPSPFSPAQTMSSLLAVNFGEVGSGLEMSSLVEVAMILLLMSLLFNLIARYLVVGKGARGAAGA